MWIRRTRPLHLGTAFPRGVEEPMNPESVAFQKKPAPATLSVKEGDSIVIIGSGMASRMNHFPHFETEVFLRFPDKNITIRNMGDEGNTPPAFAPIRVATKTNSMPFPVRKNCCRRSCRHRRIPGGISRRPTNG